MKFNNIRLLVNDFDKSFDFYKNILALHCTWGKPGDHFASFDIGIPSGLALFKKELMHHALYEDTVSASAIKQENSCCLVIEVADVDTIYQKLINKKVSFITSPKDMPMWGIRTAHFKDPENNLIEIFSYLPKEKWAEHLLEEERSLK